MFLHPQTASSKKTKIQSHNLAPAILEGLMPITTEDEPEDIDDDAACRVSDYVGRQLVFFTY